MFCVECLEYIDAVSINDCDVCEECGGSLVEDHVNGVRICDECGVVYDQIIRNDYDESIRTSVTEARCGPAANPLMSDENNFSTSIKTNNLYLKKMTNMHSKTDVDKSLCNDFESIDQVLSDRSLPSTIISIMKWYVKLMFEILRNEDWVMRGNNRETVYAVSLYYAFMYERVPRSEQEVFKLMKLDPDNISRFHDIKQLFIKHFENDHALKNILNTETGVEDYFLRMCSELGLDKRSAGKCSKIYEELTDQIFKTMIPRVLAAGIVAVTQGKSLDPLILSRVLDIDSQKIINIKKTITDKLGRVKLKKLLV